MIDPNQVEGNYRRQSKYRVGVVDIRRNVIEETTETKFAKITGIRVSARDIRLIKSALAKNFIFSTI